MNLECITFSKCFKNQGRYFHSPPCQIYKYQSADWSHACLNHAEVHLSSWCSFAVWVWNHTLTNDILIDYFSLISRNDVENNWCIIFDWWFIRFIMHVDQPLFLPEVLILIQSYFLKLRSYWWLILQMQVWVLPEMLLSLIKWSFKWVLSQKYDSLTHAGHCM